MASKRKTLRVSEGFITIRVNEKLKRQIILEKKGELMSVIKWQENRTVKKYGKPLNIRKFFCLNEEDKKKRLKFCEAFLERKTYKYFPLVVSGLMVRKMKPLILPPVLYGIAKVWLSPTP